MLPLRDTQDFQVIDSSDASPVKTLNWRRHQLAAGDEPVIVINVFYQTKGLLIALFLINNAQVLDLQRLELSGLTLEASL